MVQLLPCALNPQSATVVSSQDDKGSISCTEYTVGKELIGRYILGKPSTSTYSTVVMTAY